MAANGITVNMPPSKFNTWLWAKKKPDTICVWLLNFHHNEHTKHPSIAFFRLRGTLICGMQGMIDRERTNYASHSALVTITDAP